MSHPSAVHPFFRGSHQSDHIFITAMPPFKLTLAFVVVLAMPLLVFASVSCRTVRSEQHERQIGNCSVSELGILELCFNDSVASFQWTVRFLGTPINVTDSSLAFAEAEAERLYLESHPECAAESNACKEIKSGADKIGRCPVRISLEICNQGGFPPTMAWRCWIRGPGDNVGYSGYQQSMDGAMQHCYADYIGKYAAQCL